MSNVALWTRPAWNTDRFIRDFFGPATATEWAKGINPAVEVTKDGPNWGWNDNDCGKYRTILCEYEPQGKK